MLAEVAMMNRKPDKKRFTMYRRFIFMNYSVLGSGLRHRINEYVQELIVLNISVEAGKRKRAINC